MFGLATRIQQAIYHVHEGDLKAYQSKCKMILNNVKDYSNKELRYKLIEGVMTPEALAVSTQRDLDPP